MAVLQAPAGSKARGALVISGKQWEGFRMHDKVAWGGQGQWEGRTRDGKQVSL